MEILQPVCQNPLREFEIFEYSSRRGSIYLFLSYHRLLLKIFIIIIIMPSLLLSSVKLSAVSKRAFPTLYTITRFNKYSGGKEVFSKDTLKTYQGRYNRISWSRNEINGPLGRLYLTLLDSRMLNHTKLQLLRSS